MSAPAAAPRAAAKRKLSFKEKHALETLPARIEQEAEVHESLISPGCVVGGRVTETGVAQLWAGNAGGLAQTAQVHFE